MAQAVFDVTNGGAVGAAQNRRNDGGIFAKFDADQPEYQFREFPKQVGWVTRADNVRVAVIVGSAAEEKAWKGDGEGEERLMAPAHQAAMDDLAKANESLAQTNAELQAQTDQHLQVQRAQEAALVSANTELARLRAQLADRQAAQPPAKVSGASGPSGEKLADAKGPK